MSNTRILLRSFIQEAFSPHAPGVEIDDCMSLLGSGLLDSTGVLELVDFLESEFGIEVEDHELVPENLDSVSNLCRYLASKGAE